MTKMWTQKYIAIMNIGVPNIEEPSILRKKNEGRSLQYNEVHYFNILLWTLSPRQKINKEIYIKNYLDKIAISGTYKTSHPTEAEKYFCQEHREHDERQIVHWWKILTNLISLKSYPVSFMTTVAGN